MSSSRINYSSLSQEDLLRLVREGDEEAWWPAIESEDRRLNGFLSRILSSDRLVHLTVEDLKQEIYLKILGEQSKFLESGARSLFVWLRGRARDIFIDLRRKITAQQRDPRREISIDAILANDSARCLAEHIVDTDPTPRTQAERTELLEEIGHRMTRLGEKDHEILVLFHFDLMSHDEIAELLSISVDASKKRHQRALKKLRALLPASFLSKE